MRKPPQPPQPARKPSEQSVRRSVASSTAIETGQSIEALEAKLRNPARRFAHITLTR
ncbi:hypothetical protein [Roseateles sp. LYH14W]|uniref:Uncharacterized protein n=1 Tax=Pelomonas parva TaxID=3299032 RepID=A0ABW7F639_9BURK